MMTTAGEGSSAKIILHHLDNARSQRILWLLEELGVPYEIKMYKRTTLKTAPPELSKVHALGKAPVITDVETGISLAESGAIIEYLIAKYGSGRFEPTANGMADNFYFTHYGEGTLQQLLVNRFRFRTFADNAPTISKVFVKPIMEKMDKLFVQPELERNADFLEKHLEKVKETGWWFAGGEHPTAADFVMSFTLEVLCQRGSEYVGPNIKEWVRRLQARPAYKRGLQKCGDYQYLLKD